MQGNSMLVEEVIRKELKGGLSSCKSQFDILPTSSHIVFQKDIKGHFGCVNAIEFSNSENLCVSGGDDRRVFIWRVGEMQVEVGAKPIQVMEQIHYSNIFTLAFSNKDERVYSGGNDSLLFVHDLNTSKCVRRVRVNDSIYNVATNPVDDNLLAISSEDGRMGLYDLRGNEDVGSVHHQGTMYCAQFNPAQANILALCGGSTGLMIRDCRNLAGEPFCINNPNYAPCTSKSVTYAQWNDLGTGILATHSRKLPVYYDLDTGYFVQFNDEKYVNRCTVKSCSFITQDLVMTGSDDWNIYIWKMPSEICRQTIPTAYRVLEGHRSVVNHIRYSRENKILVSCGVEKIVKLWSGFRVSGSYLKPLKRDMILRRTSVSNPQLSDNVEEDTDMLAFFDNLTTDGDVSHDDDVLSSSSSVGISDEEIERHEIDGTGGNLRRGHINGQPPPIRYVVLSPEPSSPELLPETPESENAEHFSSGNY